jgi:RNA polymerase sigma factor (sigma-70 family)
MEDASIKKVAQSYRIADRPEDLVSRIRERLQDASAFEATGEAHRAAEERDRAETLMLKLEKVVAPDIARFARGFFRHGQPDFDDAVLEMLYALRRYVNDLSDTNRAFETMFQTCFSRKCKSAIKEVRKRNGSIGKKAPPTSVTVVSLDAPLASDSEGESFSLSDVIPDPKTESDDLAEERLRNAIAQLPPDLIAVCQLSEDGLSYDEIGARLKISSKTASARHAKAYQTVRQLLE